MPSFTFAAAAQAVIWAGLTPLFCDIDEALWAMSPTSAERLLESYGSSVAVIFPYATFGTDIDLDHYRALSLRYGIPVVIDAAASLGTCSRDGQGFGTGFPYPIVFSMHATKAFATAEAGLIYCADPGTIQALRAMSNFGFDDAQSVSMPGLNAKLNEFTALMALEKLRNFDAVMTHRTALAQAYRAALPECVFQVFGAQRQAFVFMPVLLPEQHATGRANILQLLEKQGIGARKYFSPHLALHPYLKQNSMSGDLTTTDMIARRIISLPMSDLMTIEDVQFVCNALRGACNAALL